MKDSNYKPDGTGVVMGDTKSMPDRGTSTGMNPGAPVWAVENGFSLDPEATNRIGGIKSATQSDAPGESPSDDPTFGSRGADPDDTRGYA
jgi:hypothetical protein